jgi:hypothetical protein
MLAALKSWLIMGKSWENHGEIHGKIMGKSWEHVGTYMKISLQRCNRHVFVNGHDHPKAPDGMISKAI